MDPSFRLIHRTCLSSQKSPWCPSHPQSHLHHWIYFSDCQHHLSIIFAYAHAQECRRRRGQQRMRWLDGIPEFEQSLGVGNGQGTLVCCSLWGHKGSDMTERLNWPELNWEKRHKEESIVSGSWVLWQYRCSTVVNKGLCSQSYGFSSSHVQMWELHHKECWAPMNWYFWTVVLEKTLESSLDSIEIKPVIPKGNQPWVLIGRIDA